MKNLTDGTEIQIEADTITVVQRTGNDVQTVKLKADDILNLAKLLRKE